MSARNDMPYWWEAAEPAEAATGAPPARADIVIVGGGYTGMGAAIPLARAGREVVVLERDRPGDGASSRNGGITSGNIRHSFSSLIEKYGLEQAKAFYAEGVVARQELYDFIAAEKLDCDFQPTGRFSGAMRPEILETMKREMALLHEHIGIEPAIVERQDVHDEIGSDLYHGGVRRADIGGIHPAKLHRELRRVAEAAGAGIYSGTGVTDIRRIGSAFEVTTPKGKIQAAHVIVATNGYTGPLSPWQQRRVIPIGSYVIATEEIPAETMDRLFPTNRILSDTRKLVYYYRPSPDRKRILFGGRVSLQETDPRKSGPKLLAELVRLFPDLEHTRISHSWAGIVAFTFDTLMHCGEDNNLFYGMGYCGSGVGMAGYLGAKLGRAAAGVDTDLGAFSTIPFRTRPFYTGNPWFLAPSVAAYRLRDRLGI